MAHNHEVDELGVNTGDRTPYYWFYLFLLVLILGTYFVANSRILDKKEEMSYTSTQFHVKAEVTIQTSPHAPKKILIRYKNEEGRTVVAEAWYKEE